MQMYHFFYDLWSRREIGKMLKGKKKTRRTYILALMNVNMKGMV